MLNYSYYPFNKSLENIDSEDLVLLREVSEGWYIDYKSQGLKITDFAKHLSAFANQYGGWLIIGVKESPDSNRTASEFIGIEQSELEKISRDIREASSTHINPTVLYEEKVINGPLSDIGLAKDKAILIIGIPMSHKTPHIHSSGRIYRRLSDQSKPKEETDRYILDDLWKRGEKQQKKVIKVLTDIPKLPVSQTDSSWAHIYFMPAQGQPRPSNDLSFNEFSNIVRNSDNSVLGVHARMQAVNSTANGFIARQVQKHDPSLATLTLRWWHDGVARFDIPLNKYDLEEFTEIHNEYEYGQEFSKLVYELGYTNIRIVDYSLFIQAVSALANCYLHMLDTTADKRDIYSCFTLRNVFHTSPFIDSSIFVQRAKEYSIPLTIDEKIVMPAEPHEQNMFFHKASNRYVDFQPTEDNQRLPYIFSAPVTYHILKAAGIVSDPNEFKIDQELWGFDKVNQK